MAIVTLITALFVGPWPTGHDLEPGARKISGRRGTARLDRHAYFCFCSYYGLVTLAAISALAAALQIRALRSKKRDRLSSILPAVSSSERLLVQLLVTSEIVLAMGLMTGMAALYFKSGQVMTFDHKSALAVLVFVVLAILLLLHFQSGVRGKAATQLVLLAYLLLTLGYPGVKFVTDILLS